MLNLLIKSLLLLLLFQSCNSNNASDSKKSSGGAIYIPPTIDKYGRFRKGHVRFPVSTKKDAYKSRMRSKYYYQTRGKYRARRKKH
jgi:hypothetical protein